MFSIITIPSKPLLKTVWWRKIKNSWHTAKKQLKKVVKTYKEQEAAKKAAAREQAQKYRARLKARIRSYKEWCAAHPTEKTIKFCGVTIKWTPKPKKVAAQKTINILGYQIEIGRQKGE